jgi:lysophospholipid acyltransferase
LYDVAGIVVSTLILNYAVAPFQLLDLKRSLLAWHRMGWYGHIIIGVPIIFFMNGGKRIMRAQLAKRGIVIPGGKGASAGGSNGSSAPSTPGKLGGPNGFTLTVPPIDQGINGGVKESKKSK